MKMIIREFGQKSKNFMRIFHDEAGIVTILT